MSEPVPTHAQRKEEARRRENAHIREMYADPVAKKLRKIIIDGRFDPDMYNEPGSRIKGAIYLKQYICAMEIFILMFIGASQTPENTERAKCAWVHLVAQMQAGKTGVCHALIRIIRKNVQCKKLPEEMLPNIFVVTGLSDKSWCVQMSERLSDDVKGKHIYHSPTLEKLRVELQKLGESEDGFRDVLIIIDESHIASLEKNLPHQNIISVVRRLCDPKGWVEQNIRFLTVSATDPHSVLTVADGADKMSAGVVSLKTGPDYQSVASLNEAGRVRKALNLGSAPEAVDEIRRAVEEVTATRTRDGVSAPCYHIVRAEGKSNGPTVRALKESFGDSANVETWDAESNKKPRDDTSTISVVDNINDLLSVPPAKTTFIVIKRMFSCAKTMVDKYVGVMWDYVAKDDKDSVRLQSLLGRACGYGRSKYTVVYTSERVVKDYIEHWQKAMESAEAMKAPAPAGSNYGNVGVGLGRGGKPVRKAGRVAPVPIDGPGLDCTDPNEGYCEPKWSEVFQSLEVAKKNGWAEIGKDERGFYNNRYNPNSGAPMTVAEYETVKKGKWSMLCKWGKKSKTATANMVYYEDVSDPSTARFVFKTVDKKVVDPGAVGPAAAGGVDA